MTDYIYVERPGEEAHTFIFPGGSTFYTDESGSLYVTTVTETKSVRPSGAVLDSTLGRHEATAIFPYGQWTAVYRGPLPEEAAPEPEFTTVEDLNGLPAGTLLVDHEGDEWRKGDNGRWALTDGHHPAHVLRWAPLRYAR